MPLDLLSDRKRAPVECEIAVRGVQLGDLYPYLTRVSVETSRDEAGAATLVFESRRDEQGKWSVQDAGLLKPWEPISIRAVFGSATEEVMRGFIREVQASYPENGAEATVTVTCQDESIALDREHVRRDWGADAPTTDRGILEQIADTKYGLEVVGQSGVGIKGLVLQQDGTDIDFLRKRAEANGYELIFQLGTVYFGPMRLEGKVQPTILVYAGLDSNCRSFSVSADGHQPTKMAVDLPSTDGAGTTRRIVEPNLPVLGREPAGAGTGMRDFTWVLSQAGGADEDALVARAQRKVNEYSMRVRATGELDGSLYGSVLRPGLPVGVDGVGDWLGGTYYVDHVSHDFSMDGYVQRIELIRNAYGDDLSGGIGSALAGVI